MTLPCEHLEEAASNEAVTPSDKGCAECLKQGSRWVHLRLSLSCGHVGCCDSSPNRHATAHFHQTDHPVIRSFEPGERWAYCYVDDEGVDNFVEREGEMPPVHYSAPTQAHAHR